MALVIPIESFGDNGIGKREKGCVVASLVPQVEITLQILVLQHGFHTLSCHIPGQRQQKE
jgi:hypothetical protein